MTAQPTEELFDNLMKGLSCENVSDYECSDSESEIMDSLDISVMEETLSTEIEIEESVDEIELSNVAIEELNEEDDQISSELCFKQVLEGRNTWSGETEPANPPEEHHNQIACGNDESEHIYYRRVEKGPAGSIGNSLVESIPKSQTSDSDELFQGSTLVIDEPSQDSVESLGAPIDPPLSDETTAIEMITVDINKTSPDDEEVRLISNEENNEPVNEIDNSVIKCNSSALISSSNSKSDNLSCSETIDFESDSEMGTDTILKDSSDNLDKTNSATTDSSTDSVKLEMNKDISTVKDISPSNFLKNSPFFSNLIENKNSSGLDRGIDEEGEKLNCNSYICKGCDSKFWILRFYYQHISRITTKILYDCKVCKKKMKFTNPCLLKAHFKSHGDSVDKIKISDSITSAELPGIKKFKEKYLVEFNPYSLNKTVGDEIDDNHSKCVECNKSFPSLISHLEYKRYCKKYIKCSSCPSLFSSICALKMHIRIHGYQRPYCCPECGTSFVTKSSFVSHLSYECYHFRRACILYCFKCGLILNDKKMLRSHIVIKHRTVFYKCSICPNRSFRFVTAFNIHMKEQHGLANTCLQSGNFILKCDLCPGNARIFAQSDYHDHLMNHINSNVWTYYGFKCVTCNFVTLSKEKFHEHFERKPKCKNNENTIVQEKYSGLIPLVKKRVINEPSLESSCKRFRTAGVKILSKAISNNSTMKKLNDTVKNQCEPQKGTSNKDSSVVLVVSQDRPVSKVANPGSTSVSLKSSKSSQHEKNICLLCSASYYNLSALKYHLINYHRCRDIDRYISTSSSVKFNQMKKTNNSYLKTNEDIDKDDSSGPTDKPDVKWSSVKIKQPFSCPFCCFVASNKEDFKKHVVEHREDNAYQCLECGECYVARSPLEIHLISIHSIKDPASYISSNYVHNSFSKPEETSETQPNQCSVCFDVFPDDKALHLHFRSHGMAFLKQNIAKKLSS